MGPRVLILLSGKPADSMWHAVPLKSAHWLQIYIGVKRDVGTDKGKELQDAPQDNFPKRPSEKKSHAGQGLVALMQNARLPLSSALLS